MDPSSSKRGAGALVTPRKAYGAMPFKDAATKRNQNAHFCNRIGCSGRIKCTQNARIGTSDKSKCSKPSCPSNGNDTTGKSSRNSSLTMSVKKPCPDSKRKMPSSLVKSDTSVSSSLSNESETLEPKDVGMIKGGSSSVSSNVGPRKTFHHKSPPASSVPSASRSSSLGPYNRSRSTPSCLPIESESVEKNASKKRSSEGESSLSHRGRKTAHPSPVDRHSYSTSSSGISISNSTPSSSASREDNSGGTGSTCARRSTNTNGRMRFSGPQNGRRNGSSVRQPATTSFSQIHNIERPFRGSRSYLLSSSNGENQSSRMPFTSSESGLMNDDVLHRYNMGGIAEVLLALERIEQDEELTNEQIIALETSLFLSGLNLYDQHRDMRLDIDNMSYEELLALEERMGTVSTALSEEALSKCLNRSIYQATLSNVHMTGTLNEDGYDTKCSICQEEYVSGDEIGKLVECQHGYHAACINQWLQQKNWCPICKASAESSQSSSSL